MESLKFGKNSNDIMKFDFEENRHIAEHTHPDIEILYLLEGTVSVTISHNTYQMEKDDIITISPNKSHSLHATEGILLGVLHINYREFQKYIDTNHYYLRCNSVIDKNKGYQELRKILNKIFHLYYERNQEKLYLNSLYYSFLHTLITNFAYHSEELINLDPQSVSELRTNDIINYINSNYQYALSLTDLAEHLNLSSTYLSKYIKKNLGKNFLEYLNQVRLSNAVDDMCHTDKSLSRISLDNGFPNTTAFTTTFRKEYGKNPSVWLQEYQKEHNLAGQKIYATDKNEHIRAYLEQTPSTVTAPLESQNLEAYTFDASTGTSYKKNWNRLLNIGSVTALMRSDLQEQLLLLHKELKIEYIRFWDLFTDDMYIDVNRTDGHYNFKKVDKVLDFLIENKMHPFVDLGLKPYYLTRSVDKERMTERPISYNGLTDYHRVLYAFLAHCVNRYGLEEVETWYFEQWGDPRITSGDKYGTYFDVFETAYHTVKSISPKIRIGGAGFGRLYSTLEFKEILELWKARPYHPDFLSIYSYPYLARSNNESLNDDRIQDSNFVNNQVLMMQEVMKGIDFTTPELLVTEWSSSISNWNSLNDSMYKGSFVLKTIIDNIGSADMLGYWLASDILAEYFDSDAFLHGGNGLLTMDAIKKPVFYAIQFANQLGDTLLGKSPHAMVTQSDSGNYGIVCHHYINPNFRYFLRAEDDIDVRKQFLLFDETNDLHLHFRITNVKNGRYLIKLRSLNSEHGSVQDEWSAMDYTDNLGPQDITYLKNISTPRITITEQIVDHHVLEVHTTLKPQEIQYIHLKYLIG